ncbi:MAG: hypothetical protein LBI36_02400 [Oscillospiraceae bacterium]|jgi:hypothetical protein|nr:hypothetical protein [Oscillospiraceae bacterium]
MEKLSAAKILGATKPFVAVRALAYLVLVLVMLVVGVIGLFLCYQFAKAGSGAAVFITAVIFFGGLFGLIRFAQRYILYMIKAAHVAAITEFIKTGQVPVTENGYKGVVAYGTEKIKNHFGAANVAFVADALITGATRQIMRWLNRAEKLLSWIPGADKAMAFINFVISTALNYIDEAVLSYIFYHSEEGNAFKKACDALSYYAQSWKGMLKGALKVGAFVWILRAVIYLILVAVFNAVGGAIAGAEVSGAGFFAIVCGILLAFIILYGIEAIIVEPYATCIMINDYYKAIEGQPLKRDLHGTLCKVSGKFRELFNKSGQSQPAQPSEIPPIV